MFRFLSALVIGAIIAAGIMFVLSLLIGGDWVSENPNFDGISVEGDSVSGPIMVDSITLERCEDVIGRFEKLMESSRACDVDSDCVLTSFGCPFGCNTAVRKSELPILRAKSRSDELDRCTECVYDCFIPPLGWKAICKSHQCQVAENSVAAFERATREAVTD
jgi:hypothetical protein